MVTAPKRTKGVSKELATFLRWGKAMSLDIMLMNLLNAKEKSHPTSGMVDFRCVVVSTPAMFFP